MKSKIFKFFHIVEITAFISVLALPGLVWGFLMLFSPETIQALDTNTNENREKAQFPTKFNPETITVELENYYNDHVPFRSVLISFYQEKNGKFEAIYTASILPKLSELLYGSPTSDKENVENIDLDDLFAVNSEQSSEGNAGINSEEASSAPEHHFVETQRTEPTCTRPGLIKYVCSDCSEEYTEEIPAKGHDNIYAGPVEASYTEYGCTMYFCSVCHYITKTDITGKLIDTSYFAPTLVGESVLIGRYNWLFYAGDDCISYYKGTNILSENEMRSYADLANELNEVCKEKGIRLQLMIIPNKSQIYSEYMPTYNVNEEKRETVLVDYFNKNSDVSILYPYEELMATKPYWQIYHKNDTHWNQIGAFIGEQALLRELGLKTTSIFDLDISEKELLGGDLLSLSGYGNDVYTPDIEYEPDYKPEIQITESIGDPFTDNVYRSKSDSPNKQRLTMVFDSYRLNMIPFLRRDFAECTIAHRDSVSEIKDSIVDTDILVIAGVERYDVRMFNSMQEVLKILKGE